MRVLLTTLVLVLLAGSLARAAPPPRCTPDDLGELTYRLGVVHFKVENTDTQIRDNVYTDLGVLKKAARQRNDAVLAQVLAEREGTYEWMATRAAEAGVPVYLWLSRAIDCLNALDIRRVLYWDNGRKGVIAKWRAAIAAKQLPKLRCDEENCYSELLPREWYTSRFKAELEAVRDARQAP